MALNATLGQPIIGPAGNGPGAVSLRAGYWYGAAPATAVTLHSALEVELLGFYVYRADTAGAEPTRLTPALLPATGGPSYTYWLEMIDAGGGTARYGPATATLPLPAPHTLYLPLVLSGVEGLAIKS